MTKQTSEFRCHHINTPEDSSLLPLKGLLQLTAAQQRRRSVYMRLLEAGPSDDAREATLSSLESKEGSSSTASLRRGPLRPRKPSDAASMDWMRRDLQSLLLQDDVELVLQHAVGTLKAADNSAPGGPAAGSRPSNKKRESDGRIKAAVVAADSWPRALAEAMRPFLPDFCEAFALELQRFLTSGLSVAAYDEVAEAFNVAGKHGPAATEGLPAASGGALAEQCTSEPTAHGNEDGGSSADGGSEGGDRNEGEVRLHSFGLVAGERENG